MFDFLSVDKLGAFFRSKFLCKTCLTLSKPEELCVVVTPQVEEGNPLFGEVTFESSTLCSLQDIPSFCPTHAVSEFVTIALAKLFIEMSSPQLFVRLGILNLEMEHTETWSCLSLVEPTPTPENTCFDSFWELRDERRLGILKAYNVGLVDTGFNGVEEDVEDVFGECIVSFGLPQDAESAVFIRFSTDFSSEQSLFPPGLSTDETVALLVPLQMMIPSSFRSFFSTRGVSFSFSLWFLSLKLFTLSPLFSVFLAGDLSTREGSSRATSLPSRESWLLELCNVCKPWNIDPRTSGLSDSELKTNKVKMRILLKSLLYSVCLF